MKQQKLLAFMMAGAMLAGSFATGASVLAENTTTVSLTVEPKNTYTLTVPSATTVAADGTVTALANGLKVSDGTLADGKKVSVTASSGHEWNLVDATGAVSTKIGYGLYAEEAAATNVTSWEFSKDEANADGGTTKQIYLKPVADDISKAKAATYTDTITFQAVVGDAAVASQVSFTINGTSYSMDAGTTWSTFAAANSTVVKESSGFIVNPSNESLLLLKSGEPVVSSAIIENAGYEFQEDSQPSEPTEPTVTMISFTVDNDSFSVTSGTTWQEWADNNGYNVDGIYDYDDNIVLAGGTIEAGEYKYKG